MKKRPLRSASWTLASLVLALGACEPTGPDVYAQLREQLRTQEASWDQLGSVSYTVRIERNCECANLYDVRLEIVDGAIVSGEHVIAAQPLTPAELAAQLALPDLFDVARDALDRKAAQVSVQYNVDYGYIQRLYINYDFARFDDDVEFTVTEYTPAA